MSQVLSQGNRTSIFALPHQDLIKINHHCRFVFIQRPPIKKILTLFVSTYSLFIGSELAQAACLATTISNTQTLSTSSSCINNPYLLNTGANVTINSGVTIYNNYGSGRNGDPFRILTGQNGIVLTNNGTISTPSQYGISISGGASVTSITNFGTITSTRRRGIVNEGTLTTLTNVGSISGVLGQVTNNGSIQTINNSQGKVTSSPLNINNLPSNYNIIINSISNYGQLYLGGPLTSFSFNIYGNTGTSLVGGVSASTIAVGTYSKVLQNFSSISGITGASGTYGAFAYSLVANNLTADAWDLLVSNASTNITSAGSPFFASNLGVSVNPVFQGGTLQMNQVNTSYSQNFTLDTSNTNTIDQYGNTSTFTGVFSNAVSGQAGNIVIANSTQNGGKVIFSGNNTYTGLTTINSGASLQIGSGGTSGSIVGDVANNGILGFNRSDALSYAGSISGAGSLTQLGSGALTLSGTNSYTGGTTVSSGSLIGTTSSLQGAITNNAAVTFSQNSDGAYAGNMTGTGSFTKLGSGAVTLSGTNSYSGGTTVTAGSLIGNTSSLQGNIVNNASVKFNQITDGTYAGSMSGTGSLVKLGAATLTLTGNNSSTGGTTILAGAIVNNGTYSSDIVVDAGGTLSGTGTFGNVSIGDGGTLAPGSAGSVGTMTINGNLVLDPDPATTDITISGTAASKVNVSGTASLGGAVVASGAFPAAAYLPTTKYNILTATGGLSGQFGSVSTSVNYTFLTPTLYYSSNDVTLGFALTPFSTVAKNINQRNVGNALTVAALGPVNSLGAPILNA